MATRTAAGGLTVGGKEAALITAGQLVCFHLFKRAASLSTVNILFQ